MKQLSIILGLAVLTAVASAGGADDAAKDLKLMQDKWKVVSNVAEGKSSPFQNAVTFAGNKQSSSPFMHRLITINPKESPRAFDYDVYYGDNKTAAEKGIKAIYAFEGENKLKICWAHSPKSARPTGFETKKGDGYTFMVMERIKE